MRVTRAFGFDQAGQTEIGQMRFAFCIQQDVSRFDVAMQNAVFMSIMDCARQLRDEFHRTTDRHWLAPDHFVKLAALDEFHAEVAGAIALADFVNGNDAWMHQGWLRLPLPGGIVSGALRWPTGLGRSL